jgi:hypothetical protein
MDIPNSACYDPACQPHNLHNAAPQGVIGMRLYLTTLILLLSGGMLSSCTSRPRLAFTPTELPPAQRGKPYRVQITITGQQTPVGQVFLEQGELPPGLTLHHQETNDTAEIRGMPEVAGTFKVTIGAWCFGTNVSGQTGQHTYTLTVE